LRARPRLLGPARRCLEVDGFVRILLKVGYEIANLRDLENGLQQRLIPTVRSFDDTRRRARRCQATWSTPSCHKVFRRFIIGGVVKPSVCPGWEQSLVTPAGTPASKETGAAVVIASGFGRPKPSWL
jgi:hypothetical protein